MQLKHVICDDEDMNPLTTTSYNVVAGFCITEDIISTSLLRIIPSWTDWTIFCSSPLTM